MRSNDISNIYKQVGFVPTMFISIIKYFVYMTLPTLCSLKASISRQNVVKVLKQKYKSF